jgi:hypothetical protein
LRWSCWTRRWRQTRFYYWRMTPRTARRTKAPMVAGLYLRCISESLLALLCPIFKLP